MNGYALQREGTHMSKPTRNWIAGAVKKHPGSFRRSAARAGETTREFSNEHEHDNGKIGKRARLAKTLMGLHK